MLESSRISRGAQRNTQNPQRTTKMPLTQAELTRILPQTYPFCMIDEVTELVKGERLTAVKNITANEWFFQNQTFKLDHMPEPLIIEAAAQAALVLYHLSMNEKNEFPNYFLGKIKCNLNTSFIVGDTVFLKVFANKMLTDGGYAEIEIYCKDTISGKVEIIYKVLR